MPKTFLDLLNYNYFLGLKGTRIALDFFAAEIKPRIILSLHAKNIKMENAQGTFTSMRYTLLVIEWALLLLRHTTCAVYFSSDEALFFGWLQMGLPIMHIVAAKCVLETFLYRKYEFNTFGVCVQY